MNDRWGDAGIVVASWSTYRQDEWKKWQRKQKPVHYRYPLRFEQNDGIAPHGIR